MIMNNLLITPPKKYRRHAPMLYQRVLTRVGMKSFL